MPETTPLFQTQTTYTFAEYRRYSRALQNKVMHRPLVIAVMMACLVLLALLSDDNSMRVAFLIVAVLTPLIFSLIGSHDFGKDVLPAMLASPTTSSTAWWRPPPIFT